MPAPLFLSSGDLIADRRYDFARDFQLRGDLIAAVELMAQAVELAPRFASAWFALGELREKLGERSGAIDAYRHARDADPEDRHGAKLRLIRLGAEEISDMPPAYVQSLFDQYAPRFESALLDDLDYRGPEILLKAVVEACRAIPRPVHFRRAIDLGCGTGLAARAFASKVETFAGIDLSPGMIDLARQTGLYALVEVGDMIEGLTKADDSSADLVIAADAVIYLPDLTPFAIAAARVLKPGGLLAFSVETHGGDDVVLGAGLRYAHGAPHVRAALQEAGLMLCSLAGASTRTENHEPVPGLVVVARKA
ncbi:methyltransferase domain-containing protein [Afipia sp. TerB]